MSSLSIPELQNQLKKLDEQRQDLEKTIIDLTNSEKTLLGDDYELNCPLVDQEGYPLQIDVYSISHLRKDRLEKTNDLRATNGQIAQLIIELHAAISANEAAGLSTHLDEDDDEQDDNITQFLQSVPIFRLNHIAPEGPAAQAGLLNGDAVLLFGTITQDQFSHFQQQGRVQGENPTHYALVQFGQYLSECVGSTLRVVVLRQSDSGSPTVKQLSFIPQKWAGPGVLGGRIEPLD